MNSDHKILVICSDESDFVYDMILFYSKKMIYIFTICIVLIL
jgi:hypothetical protein